jgi:hypothetical protein
VFQSYSLFLVGRWVFLFSSLLCYKTNFYLLTEVRVKFCPRFPTSLRGLFVWQLLTSRDSLTWTGYFLFYTSSSFSISTIVMISNGRKCFTALISTLIIGIELISQRWIPPPMNTESKVARIWGVWAFLIRHSKFCFRKPQCHSRARAEGLCKGEVTQF